MERLIKRWQQNTVPIAIAGLMFVFLSLLQVFRLSSITSANAASFEQGTILQAAVGWRALWHNPLNLPYTALIRIVDYFSHSIFYHRLVGALLGMLLCGLFYYIAYRWLGYRLAVLGTILFGTSSFLLHTTRLVNPATLQMLVCLLLIALFSSTYKHPRSFIIWLWALAIPLMLYVPGSVWLIVAAVYLCRIKLRESWTLQSSIKKLFLILLPVILLTPLVHFLVVTTLHDRDVLQLASWMGINLSLGWSLAMDSLKTFATLPIHLFMRGDSIVRPLTGLGFLPVLDSAVGILALIGLYINLTRLRDARWRFNIVLLAVGWLLIGLGAMSRAVVLPILYLLATIGVAFLLNEWYKVFPRNPLARGFGFGLILAVIGLSCLYNIRSYFVAWPHNQVTLSTFVCPPSGPRPAGCPQNSL